MSQNRINRRIMFAGCSGVGKTTIAKYLADRLGIPFISGSYSDLIPETKEMPHSDMINQDAQTVFMQDMKVLNLRNKGLREEEEFVTDRSFFDSAAYFINKLSHRIRECDLEHALELCRMLLGQHCTHLIIIPFSEQFVNHWVIEDNNKRVLSKLYQYQVSLIMMGLLKLWGYKPYSKLKQLVKGKNTGTLTLCGNTVEVLILDEMNYDKRKEAIEAFLEL